LLVVAKKNASSLSKVHAKVVHLMVSHYCSMSLGKVCLLGEIPVQVLAEVGKLQDRPFCSMSYLGTVALP